MFYIHLIYKLQYCIQILNVKDPPYGLYYGETLLLFSICGFPQKNNFFVKPQTFVFASINLYRTFCKKVILSGHFVVFLPLVCSHHYNVLLTSKLRKL